MIDLRFTPLDRWPGEPTKVQTDARFRASYGETLNLLEHELKQLHAKEITIQAFFTHNQIRNDGWPFSKAEPSRSGIILSFRTQDVPLSFPCDRYRTFDDNLRAIALSLQALRAVNRYGVTKRSEQYTGWKRIEAAPLDGFRTKEDAAAFILTSSGEEVHPGRIRQIIEDADIRTPIYRLAARRLHPDALNGNHELFVKLQQADAKLREKTQ